MAVYDHTLAHCDAVKGGRQPSHLVAFFDGKPECNGDFNYISDTAGNGWFKCKNGTEGAFDFTIDENGAGSGQGTYDEKAFSFLLADKPFSIED